MIVGERSRPETSDDDLTGSLMFIFTGFGSKLEACYIMNLAALEISFLTISAKSLTSYYLREILVIDVFGYYRFDYTAAAADDYGVSSGIKGYYYNYAIL